ncbi:ATP-binding protein [Paenibacillus septentrionalis]|uniref:histidine kinase n=1 Tax=Paenibacillus septentrionalis TaxID=429342 RepID=A0ABW1V861_9BACL
MSIRMKLSLAISLIVSVVLILNVVFSQINAVRVQDENIEQQITNIAKQLAVSIELIENTNRSIETELAHRLKAAAQAAEQLLDPNIEDVTIEELEQVRDELGVTDITLWVMKNGELVSLLSSNPDEINLHSKTWDYWDVAMKEVYHLKPVSVNQGQFSTNFYAGPINFAVTDPSKVNKWGYYYSGKTNYMINTMINTDHSFPDGYVDGKENIIQELINENDTLLEITAFDPEFFGKQKIIKLKQGQPIYNLDVRDVRFGTYKFSDVERDLPLVQQAIETGEYLASDFTYDEHKLTRTFIPIATSKPYVISIVVDKELLLSSTTKQLLDHTMIGIMLLLITIVGSYLIAELLTAPLTKIMVKVNAISMNQFNTKLEHNSKDELGLLASQVNTMGDNLYRYTEELKQTNFELMSTKQYLESFFDHTKDAIHIMDLDFNIIQVNKAFEEMFEFDAEELLGKPLFRDAQEQQQNYNSLLMQVVDNNGISNYETVMFTKSGTPIDVSITLSGIIDEYGDIVAFASITRNITQRKHYEELRRNNEKLSAIGQMAASIAHEIRNPLTTVQGFLSLNKTKGNIPEHHMELVMQEIHHVDLIVSQFLSMSKPQKEQWLPVRVEKIMHDIITLMDSSGKLKNVKVHLTADQLLPKVLGSEQHLKQVFVNLIKNSIEAMSAGGELFIEMRQCDETEQMAIFIRDTGTGISEEELKQIFDPFYTNKEDGTGLGLLVCQQIISNHRGTLSFSSQLGIGTTATILLPGEGV